MDDRTHDSDSDSADRIDEAPVPPGLRDVLTRFDEVRCNGCGNLSMTQWCVGCINSGRHLQGIL